MQKFDLLKVKFGRLEVLSEQPKKGKHRMWLVQCECGSAPISVYQTNLTRGHTTSCGCHLREVVSTLFSTHGMSKSRTYGIWSQMVGRVTNTNNKAYTSYGGRGITLQNSWLKFEEFLADMGEAPDNRTLDRIDNNLGYSKDNCRWATSTEQGRNKRNNVLVGYMGKTITLVEAAEIVQMNYNTLRYRVVAAKWPIAKALGENFSEINKD